MAVGTVECPHSCDRGEAARLRGRRVRYSGWAAFLGPQTFKPEPVLGNLNWREHEKQWDHVGIHRRMFDSRDFQVNVVEIFN